MGKAWYKLYYHVTWSTSNRTPIITPQIEAVLYPYLELKAKEHNGYIHACNGVDDHVHLVITIPPRLSVSEMIGKLKGSSSHYINNEARLGETFSWQEGYGALTVSAGDLDAIIHYVERQKIHHRHGSTQPRWEIDESDEIDPW
jgi:putative transposase